MHGMQSSRYMTGTGAGCRSYRPHRQHLLAPGADQQGISNVIYDVIGPRTVPLQTATETENVMKPFLTVLTMVLVTMTQRVRRDRAQSSCCAGRLSPFSGELSVRKSGAHLNIQLDLELIESKILSRLNCSIQKRNRAQECWGYEIVLGEATPSSTLCGIWRQMPKCWSRSL